MSSTVKKLLNKKTDSIMFGRLQPTLRCLLEHYKRIVYLLSVKKTVVEHAVVDYEGPMPRNLPVLYIPSQISTHRSYIKLKHHPLLLHSLQVLMLPKLVKSPNLWKKGGRSLNNNTPQGVAIIALRCITSTTMVSSSSEGRE